MKNGKPRGQYAVTTLNKNAAPPRSYPSRRVHLETKYTRHITVCVRLRRLGPRKEAKPKPETRKSASGRKNNRRRGALGTTQNENEAQIRRRKKSENWKQRKHKNGVSGSGHPFSFPEKKKKNPGEKGKRGKTERQVTSGCNRKWRRDMGRFFRSLAGARLGSERAAARRLR